MKVLFVVTHLLGTGHLARTVVLARAFAAAGHEVTVASGGLPAAHIDTAGLGFFQLPPLRSDGVNFSRLLDAEGQPVSPALMQSRRDALLACLDRVAPNALVTELFPFGRRGLEQEFRPLLDAAWTRTPRPVICASVRDILAPPSKLAKAQMARDLIASSYDAVLVHSDPRIAPLEASWPVTPDVAAKLRYTGFVAAAPAGPHPDRLGEGEVLVSTGGGSVGQRLFDTALASADAAPDLRWRLLVGGTGAEARVGDMARKAPAKVTVTTASPDFRRMLYHAHASVSLCGYNTALDILQAGTPAVFVPFDDGGETEQRLRATELSRLPGIEMLATGELAAASLLAAIGRATSGPRRACGIDGPDGARRTVEIVSDLVREIQP